MFLLFIKRPRNYAQWQQSFKKMQPFLFCLLIFKSFIKLEQSNGPVFTVICYLVRLLESEVQGQFNLTQSIQEIN